MLKQDIWERSMPQTTALFSLFCSQFDELVLHSFTRIFHVYNASPGSLTQITLAHRHAGMGLLTMQSLANPTYLSSLRQMVAELSQRLDGCLPEVNYTQPWMFERVFTQHGKRATYWWIRCLMRVLQLLGPTKPSLPFEHDISITLFLQGILSLSF